MLVQLCAFPVSNGYFWAGWTDEEEEGKYQDANDGELLSQSLYKPWLLGQPNGDALENCASVSQSRKSWSDTKCSQRQCAFCEFEYSPYIHIRGEKKKK